MISQFIGRYEDAENDLFVMFEKIFAQFEELEAEYVAGIIDKITFRACFLPIKGLLEMPILFLFHKDDVMKMSNVFKD